MTNFLDHYANILLPLAGFVGLIWKVADLKRKEENNRQELEKKIELIQKDQAIAHNNLTIELMEEYNALSSQVDKNSGAISAIIREKR